MPKSLFIFAFQKRFCKKLNIFFFKLSFFFISFWSAYVKNNFLKIKNILFCYISDRKTLWKATAITLHPLNKYLFRERKYNNILERDAMKIYMQ
jgi:hypothetical protein